MSRPILHSETESELVLQAPRIGSTITGVLALIVLLVVWASFPDHRIAQAVFAGLAVVSFVGVLRVHRLEIDLDQRTWTYRDDWIWAAPRAEGTFDDFRAVAIEPNEMVDGLAKSKLRSRLVVLEFERFPAGEHDDHDGRFPLGFPMGPNVAEEKAKAYGEKLGLPVVDRTA